MRTNSSAARCLTPVLLAWLLSGCSAPATQPMALAAAEPGPVPAPTGDIEVLTGETSHVITLDEFVAMQEIENLGTLDPGEKMICRKEKPVGTHFRSIRCFTERELNAYMKASQDWLRAAQYVQAQKLY